MPLRPSYSSSDEDNNNHRNGGRNGDGSYKKPDWLRSVQLWNQQPEIKGVSFFFFLNLISLVSFVFVVNV